MTFAADESIAQIISTIGSDTRYGPFTLIDSATHRFYMTLTVINLRIYTNLSIRTSNPKEFRY